MNYHRSTVVAAVAIGLLLANIASAALCPRIPVGWGDNGSGQSSPPPGLTNIVSVDGGEFHSIALRLDSSVIGWGYNGEGETQPPADLSNAVAIAAGAYHNLALRNDGTTVGWGADWYGQATVPVGLSNVVAIAAGVYHSLALLSDGTVVGWGADWYGEATVPAGLSNVVAIAAGAYHSLALLSNGTIVGWGYNYEGEAAPPTDLSNVVAVAAGHYHNLALRSDGTVVGWGANWYGEATPPSSLSNVIAVASGAYYSLALLSNGSIVGWGNDASGQISGANGLTGVASISAGSSQALALAFALSSPSAVNAVALATNRVSISWVDSSTGEVGFDIERALDDAGNPGTWTRIGQTRANGTNYVDSNVTTNTTYWYRVRAFSNTCGNSPYRRTFISVVPPANYPYLSAYLMATNQVTVNLSWGDYYNPPETVAGYKIERAPDVSGNPGTWTEIVTVAGYNYYSAYTDTNANAAGTYWYRVRAFNAVGNGPYSYPALVLVGPPPSAPYLYAYLVATSQVEIVVYWYDYNPFGSVAGYKVDRAPDVAGSPGSWTTITNVVGAQSISDIGGATNSTYWYRVRAYNALGNSPDSYPASVSVLPPSAPYYIAAYPVPSSLEIDVYWYSDSTAAGYKLERAPDAGGSPGAWMEIAVNDGSYNSSYRDTNATANTAYWYRVRAYNFVGISGYSYPASAGLFPPATPSYISGYPLSSNLVYVYWSYGAGLEAGYKLERAPDVTGSPGTWTQIADVLGYYNTYFYDADVTVNTTYWYRVHAYNAVGDSGYAGPLAVSILPPPAPSNLSATNNRPRQVGLSWVNTNATVYGFKIERAPDQAGAPGTWAEIAIVGSSTTNYSDTGLAPDRTFWYRVRAYNAIGDSPFSNEVSVFVRDGQAVRVMQWNIEHNLGRLVNNSSYAAQAIGRIVNYNQPDVLLFCEIDAQGQSSLQMQAALRDWVTNNVPYLGTTFYIGVSLQTDGFNRNAVISRYPILTESTYNDGLRGLHSFQVQYAGTNTLQIFHTHLKCCSDDCPRKHAEAQFDATTISAWAATNSIPYIFAGDWNDDEASPLCAPPNTITTIREGAGLVEFKPTMLNGEYRTWSSQAGSPSIRFDYILAATNRLAPVAGYVFSSSVWQNYGYYGGFYYDDSYYASDHYCVFADYFFPGTTVQPGAVDGFHTVNGSTSGGDGGAVVTVTNAADFINAVGQTGPFIIEVKGTLNLGSVNVAVKANKTILGLGTNATLIGDVKMNNGSNLVVRNITFTNPGSVGDGDGLTIQRSHHIWIDHCTFVDCGDGSADFTHASDYITVSWCKFYYTFNSGHNFVNLIGHDDGNAAEDAGKLHVTFHHNWWSTLSHERMPRVRYGRVHSYNNYFNAPGNNYCVRAALESQVLLEANTFENVNTPWEIYLTSGTPGQVSATGNLFVNVTGQFDPGSALAFAVPYTYTLDETASLASIVTNNAGAGKCQTFAQWQLLNFGCTNCPEAASSTDADGDGQSNEAEFTAGTDPQDGTSALRIVAIAAEGDDVRVTWTTTPGKTNALQAAVPNYADIFIVTNATGAVTNYLDAGGATNAPVRFYRVRLVE